MEDGLLLVRSARKWSRFKVSELDPIFVPSPVTVSLHRRGSSHHLKFEHQDLLTSAFSSIIISIASACW